MVDLCSPMRNHRYQLVIIVSMQHAYQLYKLHLPLQMLALTSPRSLEVNASLVSRLSSAAASNPPIFNYKTIM